MKKFGMLLLLVGLFSYTVGCGGDKTNAPAKDDGGSAPPADTSGSEGSDTGGGEGGA